jgi:phosphohistidine phosphatase
MRAQAGDAVTPTRKTLYLLRHGEAEAEAPGGDRARPLTQAGEAAAQALGRLMHARGMVVDHALSSDAIRARATLHALIAEWPEPPVTVIDPGLYNTDVDGLLACIRRAGDARSLLVIGHNPAMGELARALAANSPGQLAHRLDHGLPTLGLVAFALRCPAWTALQPQHARLTQVLLPGET